MHPLLTNLSLLKDSEIESAISSLSKKYWIASNNSSLQQQIAVVITAYREEQAIRFARSMSDFRKNNKGLEELINTGK